MSFGTWRFKSSRAHHKKTIHRIVFLFYMHTNPSVTLQTVFWSDGELVSDEDGREVEVDDGDVALVVSAEGALGFVCAGTRGGIVAVLTIVGN